MSQYNFYDILRSLVNSYCINHPKITHIEQLRNFSVSKWQKNWITKGIWWTLFWYSWPWLTNNYDWLLQGLPNAKCLDSSCQNNKGHVIRSLPNQKIGLNKIDCVVSNWKRKEKHKPLPCTKIRCFTTGTLYGHPPPLNLFHTVGPVGKFDLEVDDDWMLICKNC